MRHSTAAPRRRWGVLAAAGIGVAMLALAGCANGAPTPTTTDDAAPQEETLQIAYISFAVDNTYDAPMLAAAQEVAAANNAEITVFDGALDPAVQGTLIEDVIASGQYDGMIVQPIYGPAIIDVVGEAIDAGITVVNIDQILGTDFTSGATQLEGLSANVVFVPTLLGKDLGEQTVAGCAALNLDPCKVAYLHDLKTSSVSISLWDAFTEATAGSPVQVVAEGETFWNPAAAQAALADILTANPDIDAIVTSDQGLQGSVLAIEAAGLNVADFLLVGYGGAIWAVEHVADGSVFADVLMAPATTGRLGMEALIDALRNGNNHGDVNPFAGFPSTYITKDTASQFTGEWVG
ncbi:MAG TPA: sugar ABC transporter substrate-binding protein [Microbacteriaceae bacterium]|nr:sugar ABC transporter substrate-binding protein [Microbacteriaceae bacterium]